MAVAGPSPSECFTNSPHKRHTTQTSPAAGIRIGAITMPPAGLSTAEAPSSGSTPPAARAPGPLWGGERSGQAMRVGALLGGGSRGWLNLLIPACS